MISEVELLTMRGRLERGRLAKAERGELFLGALLTMRGRLERGRLAKAERGELFLGAAAGVRAAALGATRLRPRRAGAARACD